MPWPFDDIGDFVGDTWNNVTGVTGARAARGAANTQAQAGRDANQFMQGIYNQGRGDLSGFTNTGMDALNQAASRQSGGGYRTDPGNYYGGSYQAPGEFSFKDFKLEDDPGYQFRMEQGLNAAKNQASASGTNGGNLLMELMRQGQGMASAEANNAFGRYANQRDFARGGYDADRSFGRGNFAQDRNFNYGVFSDAFGRRQSENNNDFNRSMQIGGYGPQGSMAMANLGQNFGNSYSNNLMGIGNAQAAGQMGAANARSQGTQNLFNMGMYGLGQFL